MKFIILGCGSSLGVPRVDGYFGNCDPKNHKNYRSRCSALLKTSSINILFDTSPDLRKQFLDNKIRKIDQVLYSHMHADQTHGINDLRVFFIKNKTKIPIYADKKTRDYLTKSFSYCFKRHNDYPPILKILPIKKNLIFDKKIKIQSIPVKHGSINSISYIINKKLAYLPDVNQIYKKDYKYFNNLKFIIIDCLRYKKHPSHFNLEEILNLNELFKPKKMILTNMHSDLDYNELLRKLPNNIKPAYDGFKINL